MFWKHNYQGVAWAALILLLFGLPGDQFDKSRYDHGDVFVHMMMFGVLFFLLSVGFIKQHAFPFLKRNTLRKVFVVTVLYGVLVEMLQGTIFIDRSIQVSDMAFNAVGALFGLGVFASIYGIKSYL